DERVHLGRRKGCLLIEAWRQKTIQESRLKRVGPQKFTHWPVFAPIGAFVCSIVEGNIGGIQRAKGLIVIIDLIDLMLTHRPSLCLLGSSMPIDHHAGDSKRLNQ